MKLAIYLTVSEIMDLHERTIRMHGGKTGVRDFGLIESAALRPSSGYYETVFDQAAALLHSFAIFHPFVDGNKRVALLSAFVFLDLNGYEVTVTSKKAAGLVLRVIENKMEVSEIASWFSDNTRKIQKD